MKHNDANCGGDACVELACDDADCNLLTTRLLDVDVRQLSG